MKKTRACNLLKEMFLVFIGVFMLFVFMRNMQPSQKWASIRIVSEKLLDLVSVHISNASSDFPTSVTDLACSPSLDSLRSQVSCLKLLWALVISSLNSKMKYKEDYLYMVVSNFWYWIAMICSYEELYTLQKRNIEWNEQFFCAVNAWALIYITFHR
jgi:hypothetical protein